MKNNKLTAAVKKWREDETGSVAVETILMVPLLAWAFVATVTFFDAYRNEANSFKAGITISDMFSRETDLITSEYISGARGLLRFLAIDDANPDLRVTAFEWQDSQNRYRRIWSQERGPRSGLRTEDLANMTERLPILQDGEVAILVETWIEYDPPFAVGLDSYDMQTYTVISPRFATQLCYSSDPSDPTKTRC